MTLSQLLSFCQKNRKNIIVRNSQLVGFFPSGV